MGPRCLLDVTLFLFSLKSIQLSSAWKGGSVLSLPPAPGQSTGQNRQQRVLWPELFVQYNPCKLGVRVWRWGTCASTEPATHTHTSRHPHPPPRLGDSVLGSSHRQHFLSSTIHLKGLPAHGQVPPSRGAPSSCRPPLATETLRRNGKFKTKSVLSF